jgi:cell division protease FtsH
VLGDRAARAELDALLMGSCDSAKAIVESHPEVVEALRDALLQRDELVGSEITEVIESALERSEARTMAELRRSASPATVGGIRV